MQMTAERQNRQKASRVTGDRRVSAVQDGDGPAQDVRLAMDRTMKGWVAYNDSGVTPAEEFGRL